MGVVATGLTGAVVAGNIPYQDNYSPFHADLGRLVHIRVDAAAVSSDVQSSGKEI